MSKELDRLESEAYSLLELGEYDRAAELFFRAEGVEREEALRRGPYGAADRSFLFRARAGFCIWDSGKYDAARGILLEVAGFDWKKARLWSDRHDSEKAFTRLILEFAAQENISGFRDLWSKATTRGDELSFPFPRNSGNQKKLLQAALYLRQKDICMQIMALINDSMLERDHDFQILVRSAETFVSQ